MGRRALLTTMVALVALFAVRMSAQAPTTLKVRLDGGAEYALQLDLERQVDVGHAPGDHAVGEPADPGDLHLRMPVALPEQVAHVHVIEIQADDFELFHGKPMSGHGSTHRAPARSTA